MNQIEVQISKQQAGILLQANSELGALQRDLVAKQQEFVRLRALLLGPHCDDLAKYPGWAIEQRPEESIVLIVKAE